MLVRPEEPRDVPAIHGVNELAFGQPAEADIVDRLRQANIDSSLVKRGLRLLREAGCPFVIVLGHPEFYPRLGFESASARRLACQWEGVPDEAFMALVLDSDAMRGVSGIERYRDEFDAAAM